MEKDLNDLFLQQLRLYAKQIGIKSPTSCTKKELIKKIQNVENGKVAPYYSKRGRPMLNGKYDINENQKIEISKTKLPTDKYREIEKLIDEFKENLFKILFG